MTICAVFDGRTQRECTRGIACICEPECSVCEGTKKVSDGYEDLPCSHCDESDDAL
jgi:hypothetical protein